MACIFVCFNLLQLGHTDCSIVYHLDSVLSNLSYIISDAQLSSISRKSCFIFYFRLAFPSFSSIVNICFEPVSIIVFALLILLPMLNDHYGWTFIICLDQISVYHSSAAYCHFTVIIYHTITAALAYNPPLPLWCFQGCYWHLHWGTTDRPAPFWQRNNLLSESLTSPLVSLSESPSPPVVSESPHNDAYFYFFNVKKLSNCIAPNVHVGIHGWYVRPLSESPWMHVIAFSGLSDPYQNTLVWLVPHPHWLALDHKCITDK